MAGVKERFIAGQMALGFGAVTIVAVAMCAMLLSIIYDVSGMIASMRHDEGAIRQGLELATAVREFSSHISHTVIEADASHLDQVEQRREQVLTRIQQLTPYIPEQERFRLQKLREQTREMQRLLVRSALPAARRNDLVQVRKIHNQIEALAQNASKDADILAQAPASHMVHSHVMATSSTRRGLIGGGLCVALVIALSIGFTLHLRAVVLKPLSTLSQAAKRLGTGEFGYRVENAGKGELASLAQALNVMADELQRREKRLLKNERMAAIGQLAAGVAHELNNPIAIIRGYLKTMSPEDEQETLREELTILDEEAGHCQRIANDLLSYAQTDGLTVDEFRVNDFLTETAKRFEGSPAFRGVPIEVDAEQATLEGDRVRLRQVVLNLLANASQASPNDETVVLRGKRGENGYEIEIEDHGTGIDPEDRERIFEPFYSKRRGGSGLGLAVCQGIVKAHGGSIYVQHSKQGGAIFRVHLPLKTPENLPESQEQTTSFLVGRKGTVS
jgi:two-component system, NtrC family, sensor kinase